MNRFSNYNAKRKAQSRARARAMRNYGKTAVHVVLNREEIERRYFADYDDAMRFVNDVNNGIEYPSIKGVSAFTNY